MSFLSRSLCLPHTTATRLFSHTSLLASKPLPPRKTIPLSDLSISYLKGTGPGGQKINKTSSAVQMKHLPTGIVIKCQETRSRDQNYKYALRNLQDKIEVMEMGGESRVEKKREEVRRRKASKLKKSRRKYKALGEGGEEVDGAGKDGVVVQNEDGQGEREAENGLAGKDSKSNGVSSERQKDGGTG